MASHPTVAVIADDPLFQQLRQASLQHIVDSYDEIEFNLGNTAASEFKRALRESLDAWIDHRRDDVRGQLRVGIFKSPQRISIREHLVELDSPGRLRVVVVESDYADADELARHGEFLARLVKQKYDALVTALEIHAKEVGEHSLDICRGLVMSAIDRGGQIRFYDDCWLIASDEERGTLLLTEELLHRALVYFRGERSEAVCPLEMLLGLMRSKFPYQRTLSVVAHRQKHTRLIGDFKSSKYRQTALDLWLAIGTLHDFEDFAVIPLASAGRHALTLGCKARVHDAALRALEPLRQTIQDEFERGAETFRPLFTPSVHDMRTGSSKLMLPGSEGLNGTRLGLFISYSKSDRDVVQTLLDGLAPGIQIGLVEVLFDERIEKGAPWEQGLKAMITRADVALFLVSRYSLASPVIMRTELPLVMERVRRKELEMRWLPVQASLWELTPFEPLQASWPPSNPLRGMTAVDHDRAIQLLCREILELAGRKKT